jgi:ribosomal protein S27E
MAIKVKCPGCGKILSAQDSYHGKIIQCPNCGTEFQALTPDEAKVVEPQRRIFTKRALAIMGVAAGLALLRGLWVAGKTGLWSTGELSPIIDGALMGLPHFISLWCLIVSRTPVIFILSYPASGAALVLPALYIASLKQPLKKKLVFLITYCIAIVVINLLAFVDAVAFCPD